jgi:hypothetical protein
MKVLGWATISLALSTVALSFAADMYLGAKLTAITKICDSALKQRGLVAIAAA